MKAKLINSRGVTVAVVEDTGPEIVYEGVVYRARDDRHESGGATPGDASDPSFYEVSDGE
ncbi:hypothetical protein ELQ92_08075 [Labedella populi]|uniref:Uncharacterized protein n=1 Tax=Labedella populi TaxID=2498850 RepID=A0A444QDE5_9MICO|nr:hypothetical protein [Labedella populi]RWZ64683.1 hypothetical protein ELQ92_08075 [Labedella populi]